MFDGDVEDGRADRETGVSYRALACASLIENALRQAALIRDQGAFYWPTPGDLKEPACATRDVAAVVARLLLDPSWSGVDSIPMLGPEDISFDEMMAIISDVIGKPVQYHLMSMDDLKAMMIKRGASEGMAQAMVNVMTAKNEGMDHLVERSASASSDTGKLITGNGFDEGVILGPVIDQAALEKVEEHVADALEKGLGPLPEVGGFRLAKLSSKPPYLPMSQPRWRSRGKKPSVPSSRCSNSRMRQMSFERPMIRSSAWHLASTRRLWRRSSGSRKLSNTGW
ncbi:hypothetical protein ABID21_004736 [Pseudorhizobium tarimense]|uniref:NmrA-like domain-containing protein n=1 Tax=Pseudorhizobium tarimense TaxID=1079109 RepID=A0ABV2HDG9_9HYPH